jgi:hypothetical protein
VARHETVGVLVTISATVNPSTDLGFLFHKQREKVYSFPVTAGRARVFYPEVTARRCMAALLLDADLVAREPLWGVHECVFAALALESEPVDPLL